MIPTRFGSAVPLADEVLDAPGDVVLHLSPHSPLPAFRNFLPYPVERAEVGLQDGVATVGEELGERVVAPVSRAHGPPCGSTIERQVLRRQRPSAA